jgi:hypothetical protein
MPRRLAAALVFLALLCPAAIQLYMKDGTRQSVREYKVLEDRVRYYSTERGDWEEVPLDLVDLKRTRAEESALEEERKKESLILAAEDKAEREAQDEIARVPPETGAYWINGKEIVPIKQAETKINTNKRRSILKAITPIPILTGKANLEVDGEAAAVTVTSDRPEFYFRPATPERFTIIRVKPQKGVRIVEVWSTVPVTKEIIQEHEAIEIFRHQVADGLYKIWPQKPIAPGQYAVIEFTETKGNTTVWDFAFEAAK